MKRFIQISILSVVLGQLAGCANNMGHSNQSLISENPRLLPTQQFLPKPELDSVSGKRLAYQAAPNPYLEKKQRLKPETIALFIKAKRSVKDSQLEQAKQYLKKLIAKDDSVSGPWVLLGDIAVQEKDLESAQNLYKKAIEVNRLNVSAYLLLSQVLRKRGDYLDAQNVYHEALSVWPDCPEAHLNLGVLYDLYLDHPINAEKHLSAHQLLTNYRNLDVEKWLDEIEERTGISRSFPKQ